MDMASDPASETPAPSEQEDEAAWRGAILERHVEQLLGQLYHQIELIQSEKARADHFENLAQERGGLRGLLEDAHQRLAELTSRLNEVTEHHAQALSQIDEAERLASGLRAEVERSARIAEERRGQIELLHGELGLKQAHIERLEQMLQRVWNSPVRRAVRRLKELVGSAGDGDGPTPA